jgi:hypothetical protein
MEKGAHTMAATMEEQAALLEQSYKQFHRINTQPWPTDEDRREALETLKQHLKSADQTLRLHTTPDTALGRSKLHLWTEIVRTDLKDVL